MVASSDSTLPQRDPFVGPPGTYCGAPGDVVEVLAEAVREWADRPAPTDPTAKPCPRCTFEDAEPDTGICRYCTAAIKRAGDALLVAMRAANATTDRPAGWLQRDDGSWAPVDDHGFVGQTFALELDDHHEIDEHAVITVEPVSIDDTEVD
ncbi:hypothetical protein OG563_29105 [Nocardia vinacea]|uniref:Uncharacterized protein n=1 Tax=Nocardia vinacea TaxID=96468 RepID=A0ABZ1YJ77_9NOCA|nr:hypothetical protein [Nocardia vinacea]